jgi:hypothetical protein
MTRKEALFLAHIRRRLSDCGQTDAFDFCEARAKYRVGEVSREAACVGVFVRRFRRLSCHGAYREPQVGMAGDV